MKEAVIERARALGFDLCRVDRGTAPPHAAEAQDWLASGRHGTMGYLERTAVKRADPALVLPGVRSVVLLGVSYHQAGVRPSPEAGCGGLRGVVARYARHADYHEVLAPALRELCRFIDQQGGPGTRSRWYTDTGPVLERDLAQRAGLGFVGKHTNLISRELGNWFLIGEVLTTAEMEPDAPEPNRCGVCTRCLAACPTSAITAPFQLDARLCISYLTIELKGPIPEDLRPAIGRRIFGCDDCLEACPWNRFAREGRLLREHRRPELAEPELEGLLALDPDEFRRRFAGTPLERSKRRGLLRNVAVALGNVGDRGVLPALSRAALDPEPLIAEHARWAIGAIEARCPLPPASEVG